MLEWLTAMSHQQHYHKPPLPDLANTYRELYRAKFRADVQAGAKTPLILPFHLLAYWVIPTLYLAIPHKNKPWLYRARWLVLAVICLFNWYLANNVSSECIASAYGAGLIASWGTIWNFHLLVFSRPQWDAKRVERRRIIRDVDKEGKKQGESVFSASHPKLLSSSPDGDRTNDQVSALSDLDEVTRSQSSGRTIEGKTTSIGGRDTYDGVRKRGVHAGQSVAIQKNSDGTGGETEEESPTGDPRFVQKTIDELLTIARENEYEYYWQEYPADASFRTRLDWAFDIVSSFRLTGWNWAASCLPSYELPPRIGPYQLPLEYVARRSKQGFQWTPSRLKLVLSRYFSSFLPSYIILDFCATMMTMDPHFIVGPEHNHPLPPHLASLHPVLLFVLRTAFAFAGVWFALQYLLNTGVILLALYCPPLLGFRTHPWHLPSLTGSFTAVLDRGLAGFWGVWWHQTFRVGFAAPTKWLVRHGYLPPPRTRRNSDSTAVAGMPTITILVSAAVAFALSGFFHAGGSYTSVPRTKYWEPPLFFALSGLGTVLQAAVSHLLRNRTRGIPRWIRRVCNVLFVTVWLTATSPLLLDDFARAGIWLWEPVPFSFARAAGLGADSRVWRYDWDSLPYWQWGSQGRWWETGLV
ncbi:hypothetical protein F4777DRAFT_552034, partial [Nemania sp. FL0916]